MGELLLEKIKDRKNRNYFIIAIFSLCTFYLIHSYAINNLLFSPDSLLYPEFYNTEQRIYYGRWFLSIACSLGSFYDVRPVNAFLSFVYLLFTNIAITKIFEIKNIIASLLISGLVISFFSISATIVWLYTADGYMLAFLFSVLALLLIKDCDTIIPKKSDRKNILCNLGSIVLLCLSCAIYQTYISVYISLVLGLYLFRFTEERKVPKTWTKRTNKISVSSLKWLFNKILVLIIALASYYIIWKLICKVTGIQPSGYQGISGVGYSVLDKILDAPMLAYKDFLYYMMMGKHITVIGVAMISAYILSIAILIIAIIENQAYKRKLEFAISVIGIIMFPLFAFMWHFASESVRYHGLMTMSLVVPLIVTVAIAEKNISRSKIKNIVLIVLTLFVFVQSVSGNIFYLDVEMTKETTIANGVELKIRIDEAVSENDEVWPQEILVYGNTEYQYLIDSDTVIGGAMCNNLLIGESSIRNWLAHFYGYNFIKAENDEEYDPIIEEMPCWPVDGSVAIVDNVLIIKLSE